MANTSDSTGGVAALSDRKCVPCSTRQLLPLSEEEARALHAQIPGWELVLVDGILRLRRSWKVKNFAKGLDFFHRLAQIAEAEGHHPDLHLEGWNNVRVELWTHSIGGLHENDFILAAKVSDIEVEDLLSKKKEKPPTLP